MIPRSQRTISRSTAVTGIGFLTGADVRLEFHPAPEHYGIAFQRTDCPGSDPIPALVEYTAPRQRRTALSHKGVTIELIEHAMAALAGLRIDNCLVTVDAEEAPGCDGSCLPFVQALLEVGVIEQTALKPCVVINQPLRLASPDGRQWVELQPAAGRGLTIEYTLDYGLDSPIPPQQVRTRITPESFIREIAFARTFVLEVEARALQAQGYGSRLTTQDLIIYGPHGVIGNALRAPDECARHKILDCIGDFALLGCELQGTISCHRSGHQMNADAVRLVAQTHQPSYAAARRAA